MKNKTRRMLSRIALTEARYVAGTNTPDVNPARLASLKAERDAALNCCAWCKQPCEGEAHDWCRSFAKHIAAGGTLD